MTAPREFDIPYSPSLCYFSPMAALHIGFLGLGLMGTGMARRLLAAGFHVTVFNRNAAKAAPLAAAGARVARTPREAAGGADIVICMVADDTASCAMWLGVDGALAGAPDSAALVECSTLTVSWVKELATAAAATGRELVDAPVTGSKNAAAAGELVFLAGGSAAALARVQPALAAMGRKVTHLGPTGSGAMMKLVNNFVAGVQVAALAEAVAWLERSGLDRTQAISILAEGSVGSPVVKMVGDRMRAEDFSPHFPLKLMAKDLDYATREAAGCGQTLSTATSAHARFRGAIAAGLGDRDMAAVVLPLREEKR
jgi:3-hydroxyisobutyrate dehydrogenase